MSHRRPQTPWFCDDFIKRLQGFYLQAKPTRYPKICGSRCFSFQVLRSWGQKLQTISVSSPQVRIGNLGISSLESESPKKKGKPGSFSLSLAAFSSRGAAKASFTFSEVLEVTKKQRFILGLIGARWNFFTGFYTCGIPRLKRDQGLIQIKNGLQTKYL